MTTEATETGPLLDSILGFLSGAFGEDLTSVPADTPFFDLGADSLLMINVLREIEQEHHVKITMRELFDETGTPRLLAELVAARLPRQPGRPQQPQQPGTVPRPAAAPAPPPAPAPAPAPTRPASDSAPPVPHAVPHAVVADTVVADTGFVTRQELRELAQRVQQLSQIQLQMLTQLSRISDLLAPRSDATAALTDDEVVR